MTYAQTAFDPFEERPFCAVDSLVFAWLSYLRLPGDMAELTNWQGLDVRELLRAECYRDMIDDLWDPEGSRALLEAVAASPRYRGVHVCGYRAVSDVVATEQFAAMAFRFPAGFSYLSFRGTDSTIVGWKEDFNMAFRCPVPAQESATRYVDEAADAIDKKDMKNLCEELGDVLLQVVFHARMAEVIPRAETLRCTVRQCAPMSPASESNGRIPMMARASSRSF